MPRPVDHLTRGTSIGVLAGVLGAVLITSCGSDLGPPVPEETPPSEGWYRQAPGLVVDGFLDIDFVNADQGWAVGEEGAIFRTTDGGRTWQSLESGFLTTMLSVDFMDDSTGVVVGALGQILRTEDGGESWKSQKISADDTLFDIWMMDADTAVAVGTRGSVLRTTDGGLNWSRQEIGDDQVLEGIWFTGQIGWIVGYRFPAGSSIFRSTDHGLNWTPVWNENAGRIIDIAFFDGEHGVAVGERAWLATDDGGSTWTRYENDRKAVLQSVVITGASTAITVGLDNTFVPGRSIVLQTTDFGNSWTPVRHPLTTPLASVSRAGAGRLVACGDFGAILLSEDLGLTWRGRSDEKFETLLDVAAITTETAVAVGAHGTMLFTSDGGEYWDPLPTTQSNTLNCVEFRDAVVGVAVGDNGTVLRTTNGGWAWEEMPSGTNQNLRDVGFTEDGLVFVVGDGGTICYSRDAAQTWSPFEPPEVSSFNSVRFRNYKTGLVLSGGWIHQTINGGFSWYSQTTDPWLGFTGVRFFDSLNACAIGYQGRTAWTSDAGVRWKVRHTGYAARLADIEMFDPYTATVVGHALYGPSGGLVLRTSDAGLNWDVQLDQPGRELKGVSFSDADHGWAVGTGGSIFRTIDGGGGR